MSRQDLRRRPPRPGRLGAGAPRSSAGGYRNLVVAHACRARSHRPGAVRRVLRAREAGATCSWRRPRSAASSPTTPIRRDFIHDNLAIQTNVIHAAWRHGVKQAAVSRLVSCIYPRDCPQPMQEEYLLTGPLEPTNEPYAIAKIAGIKMCWALQPPVRHATSSASMPTNLYGPGDNYDLRPRTCCRR